MHKDKGFTLMELVIVVLLTAILSGIILFSISQYINKGKDSNISANLAILIPAGEVYYNANNGNGYEGFCTSTVAENAKSQMSQKPSAICGNNVGFCCAVDANNQSWAACVKKFTASSPQKAFCVDSRGVKKDIDDSACVSIGTWQTIKCP